MNDAPSSSSLLPDILLILVIVIVVCMALALIAIPIVGLVVLGRKKKTANKHFTQVAASLGSRTRCSVFNDTYSMQGRHHNIPQGTEVPWREQLGRWHVCDRFVPM